MRLPRVRFTIGRLGLVIVTSGVALAYLKIVVAPRPMKNAYEVILCAVLFYILIWVWFWPGFRDRYEKPLPSRSVSDEPAFSVAPEPPEPEQAHFFTRL